MITIKNLNTQGVDIVVKGTPVDGVPKTVHIRPGQSLEVDADPDHPHLRGLKIAGSILISEPAVVQATDSKRKEG